MPDLTPNGVLNAIDDVLYVIDGAQRLTFLNARARQLWNVTDQHALGRDFTQVRPSTGPELTEPLTSALCEQRATHFELHPPVSPRALSVAAFPHAGGLIVQERDVTERWQTERARQASHERLTLALDAAGMGMWDEDLTSGKITWVGCMHELLGLPLHTAPSAAAFQCRVHPDDLPSLSAAYERALYGAPYDEEFRVVWPDGQVRWLHTVGQVHFEHDRAVRSMGVDYDITERKTFEQHLRTLNARLERRVSERTAALNAHAASLQAANEELEAFSYSVSHDLRTPLRHIRGFSSLLQSRLAGQLDAQNARFLQALDLAAERLEGLIDAMLDFSRTSRQPLQLVPVDLAALTERLRADFTPDLADREVHWQVADLPVVQGDREALQRVLLNLLSNALKYSRPWDVTRIELWAEAHPGEWRVFVRDNGVGFDARYQDKLFGVFQRLHRHDEFEGVGVGLASVRRVVERHGGRVWASSVLGQGATFAFSLPEPPQPP